MAKKEPEPGVQELFDAIAACLPDAIAFQDTVMRSAAIHYATAKDFNSGEGAAKAGGRWNPRGIRAVYASATPFTAVYEAYQNFGDVGFENWSIRPRVFCGAAVTLRIVLDFTNSAIRRRLGFTLAEILDEDWKTIQSQGDESWTQAAGRGAFIAGFEALRLPSARYRPDG
ncbi:MAG TPA: RES family NAD+ phosphorylase, partial [Lacipirellulaceae bacterium]|nr:RES family NAD+ phosphorylase [Lacipirellulaceae bacterium]